MCRSNFSKELCWRRGTVEGDRIGREGRCQGMIQYFLNIFLLVCMSSCVCRYMCVHMEARRQPQVSGFTWYLPWFSVSLAWSMADSLGWLQQAPMFHLSPCPQHWITGYVAVFNSLMWVMRTELRFSQSPGKTLHHLNCLSLASHPISLTENARSNRISVFPSGQSGPGKIDYKREMKREQLG